jgi:hypothetical protein
MAKLLLTKEQVFELKDKSLSYHIIGTIMTHNLMDDLLVLHSELNRLHTAIDGAMEEIGLKYTSCEFTASYREALGDALDILNKHLGETDSPVPLKNSDKLSRTGGNKGVEIPPSFSKEAKNDPK